MLAANLMLQINTPVRFNSEDQDTIIHPGDYLIADLDGVVCLPKDLAEQAIDLIPSQAGADDNMAAAIREGMTFSDASKKYRASVKYP